MTVDAPTAIASPRSTLAPPRAAMTERFLVAERQALQSLLPRLSGLTAEPAGRRNRNHHWVPKFWLKHFADNLRVCVVDPTGEQSPKGVHVRRGARGRDLYAMRANVSDADQADGPTVTVYWEHVTGVFDDLAAPLFDRLVTAREESSLKLSDTDRYLLSVFFALQSVRVPAHLSNMRTSADQTAQIFAMLLASAGRPRDLMTDEMCREAGIDPAVIEDFDWEASDFGPDGNYKVSIDRLTDMPSMLTNAFDPAAALSVFARSWMLVQFPQGRLTLPADTGIHLVSYEAKGIWSSPGLLTADQMLVPMSRDTLLVMHWHGDEWQPSERTAAGYVALFGSKGERQVCHPDDAEQVMGVWQACRKSLDERDALIRKSTNHGINLAVL